MESISVDCADSFYRLLDRKVAAMKAAIVILAITILVLLSICSGLNATVSQLKQQNANQASQLLDLWARHVELEDRCHE